MNLVRFLLAQSRGTMVLAIFAGVLSGSASAGLLALINLMVSDETYITPQPLAWLFWFLCLFVPFTQFVSSFLLLKLGQHMVHDLRMEMSGKILETPLASLETIGSHKLLATLTEDLTTVTDSLVIIPVLVINFFTVLGCLLYLAWLSPTVFLGILLALGLGILMYQLPLNWSLRRLHLAREKEDALFKHLRGLLDGGKELKLHRKRRNAFLDLLKSTSSQMRDLNITANAVFRIAASSGQTLVFVLIGLLLLVAPRILDIEQSALIGYTLIVLYVGTPTQTLLNSIPWLGRASVSIKKVETLGFSFSAPSAKRPPQKQPKWSSLELTDVIFRYGNEDIGNNFALGPINLRITQGELVFIVGGNGSGKTTLLKLLTGLYLPHEGSIRFNEDPVTKDNVESYREAFSVVFGDFFLFESLLGIEGTQVDQTARSYLASLQLEDKVTIENGVLSTTALSQGQRKRLALLTAYLEDREVYVFDEWAADQDPQFREIFYHQILPNLKQRGKTILVVTHDDRFFDIADRIIKMDYAQIESDQQMA